MLMHVDLALLAHSYTYHQKFFCSKIKYYLIKCSSYVMHIVLCTYIFVNKSGRCELKSCYKKNYISFLSTLWKLYCLQMTACNSERTATNQFAIWLALILRKKQLLTIESRYNKLCTVVSLHYFYV